VSLLKSASIKHLLLTIQMDSMADSNAPPLQDDSNSVWMLVNGSAKTNSSVLDTTMLHPFEALETPPNAIADVTKSFMINQTDIVTWVVDQYPYAEADIPIVFGNSSDGWQANTTQHLPSNATIDIIMNIANNSMDTVSSSHIDPVLSVITRRY
jgi:hypothetical protein